MSIALTQKVKELEARLDAVWQVVETDFNQLSAVIHSLEKEIVDLNNKYKMLKVSSAKIK